ERRFPVADAKDWMLMHSDGKLYHFKNRLTRNYIGVNIDPTWFNLAEPNPRNPQGSYYHPKRGWY
ncbi:MAG: hypothetical protein ABH950_10205, partial [Candidatus Altiarchaeota archaeon]